MKEMIRATNLSYILKSSTLLASCLKFRDRAFDFDNDLTDGYIQQFIDTYSSERGYTSLTTPSDIKSVFEHSAQLLALLIYLFKHQNAVNAVDVKGNPIYQHLFKYAGIGDFVGINSTSAKSDLKADTSISNHTWETVYVESLKYIFVSPELLQFLLNRYGVFHMSSADSDNVSFVDFVPNYTTDIIASFNSVKSSLKTALTTEADILPILNSMGFSNKLAQSLEFRRVRSQDVIATKVNTILNTVIINAHPRPQIDGGTDFWSDTYKGRYYYMESGHTLFDAPEYMDLDLDTIIHTYILETTSLGISIMQRSSTGVLGSEMRPIMFGVRVATNASLSTAASASVYNVFTNNLGRVIEANALANVPTLPLEVYFGMDYDGSDWNVDSTTVGNTLNDGSVFQLPDATLIQQMAEASLLFGGEYRQKLRLLIAEQNKFQPINVV